MHTIALDVPLSRLDDLRRRTVRVLFSGVALGSTGHIAAVTVATIVAEDLSGSPLLSGAPGAAVVLGAAVGAASLSRLMVARGRRIGLSSGYLIGVAGALLAGTAVVTRSFPLLLLGSVLIGFGNASNQLSRYAAADLFPASRRASAIGIVVWGATFG
ncbi:MAG: MFS transporter, partial [Chloroflexota bacterium]